MKRATLAVGLLALVGAAGAWAPAEPLPINQPDIRREGSGERRDALTKMELTAFKSDTLGLLSDWTNGAAPTAESLKGKVLLIATWSAWIPASQQMITRLAALADKYGKDGLVVLAVHDGRRFDAATAFLTEKGIKVLTARDADGKFRKAILSDSDPDLYLVDRAGNMRFADFETEVVDRAVAVAVGETAEAAAALPQEVADAAKSAREAAGRTRDIGGGVGKAAKPKVVFAPPSAEAYDAVLWPKKNEDQMLSSQAQDVQGSKFPGDFSKGEWLSEKPEMLGKIVVVDFWATWCPPCIRSEPLLEDMALKLRDDLVIVGVSGYGSDEKNKLQVQQFLRHHPDTVIYQLFDSEGLVQKPMMVRGLPTVFIMSTDGTVRWEGNPLDPNFRKITEAIIKIDPGVQARRAAEAKAAASARGSIAPN